MRTIITLLIISIPLIGKAQLEFGVHGGVNISTSSYTGILSTLKINAKSDYFLGITTGVKLSNKFSLKGDVQYSRKGHQEDFPESIGFHRYHYLDIVPHLEYRVWGPLAISAGFNFGFSLRAESKLPDTPPFKINDLLKKTDAGMVLGAKVYLKNIWAFVRYNRGISNVIGIDFPYVQVHGVGTEETKQFNRNWQIGLGYVIKRK